jgi:hypothetical protein
MTVTVEVQAQRIKTLRLTFNLELSLFGLPRCCLDLPERG